MRLSGGFSLLGILVALVIVALLAVHLVTRQSNASTQGPVGIYRQAITNAENSAAQQDGAASTVSTLPAP